MFTITRAGCDTWGAVAGPGISSYVARQAATCCHYLTLWQVHPAWAPPPVFATDVSFRGACAVLIREKKFANSLAGRAPVPGESTLSNAER